MSDMIYTRHAEIRTQQRAMRKEDIRLIQEFGTPVDAEHLVDAKPGRCSRDRKPQAGNPVFEPAQKSQGRHFRSAPHHGVSLTARRPETRAAPWKAEGIGEIMRCSDIAVEVEPLGSQCPKRHIRRFFGVPTTG